MRLNERQLFIEINNTWQKVTAAAADDVCLFRLWM